MDGKYVINNNDNVYINLENGHKYARCGISRGENIIKYGFPIGHAVCDIKKDEHVHSHNLKTNLTDISSYEYNPDGKRIEKIHCDDTFMGYIRKDGRAGIRNDIWIINTVGCINKTAEIIAGKTGALNFPHPFGCSQLGDDLDVTQKVLSALVKHPNAGGVLVIGLGCENNNIDLFKKALGSYDKDRVRFLNSQDSTDEISEGVKIVEELKKLASGDVRVPVPISKLTVGLKCGGSDGYSGITANPLVGRLCDKLVSFGASCVLSEVPEMFGAEEILMKRCVDKKTFDKSVKMINNYKEYFISHGQPIYENPSPGNKAGGITTLEEKSLGCVQKGGKSEVTDVLTYGDTVSKCGLSLLNGPGNDLVAVTNLACSGANLILFTTGRGTPFGGPVPTVKISTNSPLAEKKKNWIDFDAGRVLNPDADADSVCDELYILVRDVASGKKCLNEVNGYREISIFKDGVTL